MVPKLDDADAAERSIGRAIERRHGQILERFKQLVILETPTSDAAAIDALVAILAERYVELGGKVRTIGVEGGSHIVADFAGAGRLASEPPVLLVGHSDTVWPRGTLDELPWRIDEGTVTGPGNFDMKSGLVIIETVLDVLQETSCDHRPVRVAIACDEEIGSPTFEATFRGALDGVGCVLGFESPHPDGALKTGRYGSTRFELHIDGLAAHAALDPGEGVSAIDELVDQLISVRAIVDEVNGSAAEPLVLLNVGAIDGGARANVVPDHAHALIGLRFATTEAEEQVLGRLERLEPVRPRAVIRPEVASRRPTWALGDATQQLLGRVQAIAAGLGVEITGRVARGAADTNLAGALGIPTLDGFGPTGGGAHARSENSDLESLYARIALLCAFLSAPTWSPSDPPG
jgi:glutamate carboxypeptidase